MFYPRLFAGAFIFILFGLKVDIESGSVRFFRNGEHMGIGFNDSFLGTPVLLYVSLVGITDTLTLLGNLCHVAT